MNPLITEIILSPQQWPKGEKQDWGNIYRLFIKYHCVQYEDISFKPFLSWKEGEPCLLKDIPHPLYECPSFKKLNKKNTSVMNPDNT